MTYDPTAHLKRRADEMARDAEANATERGWCSECPAGTVPHRVRYGHECCPVCLDRKRRGR